MKQRALLSWSTGKDSAWSLHVLRQDPDVEVVGHEVRLSDENAAEIAALKAEKEG